MDAEGGENIELLAALYAALRADAAARGLLRDDFYFFSDGTLETFKRFQGFGSEHTFPGTRLEQAELIWRGSPLQVMRAILEANGFGPTVLPEILALRGIQTR
jgi:hypothetical protein